MSKDSILQTLVTNEINRRYNSGELQTIQSTFSKIPKARLMKQASPLVFDEIRHAVENSLSKEEFRRLKKIDESKHIRALPFKLGKSATEATIRNEQAVVHEKLKSGATIQRSLRYLKSQHQLGLDIWLGDPENSFSQVEYIRVPDAFDVNNTRLFIGNSEIRKLFPYFEDDHLIEFKNTIIPSHFEMDKRAEVLAKLYLQEVYHSQLPIMEQQERNEREELQKNIEMERMKAQIAEQKAKEEKDMVEEQFHDNDLMKQVIKIEGLLERKMNTMAFEMFNSKEYDESVRIKKSLEKMKRMVRDTPQAADKLKYLIRYKQDKRY